MRSIPAAQRLGDGGGEASPRTGLRQALRERERSSRRGRWRLGFGMDAPMHLPSLYIGQGARGGCLPPKASLGLGFPSPLAWPNGPKVGCGWPIRVGCPLLVHLDLLGQGVPLWNLPEPSRIIPILYRKNPELFRNPKTTFHI